MSEKKNILIIEDEEEIREILEDFLESFTDRYNLHFAENGTQAAIKCHNIPEAFHLIISDQHMPYMDGISLLKFLRNEDEKHSKTNFIFLSAYINNIQSILEENENVYFLDKPISVEDFNKTIGKLL
jgi:CheY-like chemotaxis protein